MKKAIILIIILLILGTGVGIVFAMTDIQAMPQPKAYVIAIEGSAKIMTAGGSWIDLQVEQELASGDTIKTGSASEVELNFFDNSTSRIGENTEVTLDELFIDNYNYNDTKVSVGVKVGRVWSRIVQMVDKDAEFEVSSNNTVATVRGTTFDFLVSLDGVTDVNSAESVVDVSAFELKEDKKNVVKNLSLKEGNFVRIGAKLDEEGKIVPDELNVEIDEMPLMLRNSAWFKKNQRKDKKFEEDIKKKQAEINKQIAGNTLPGESGYETKKTFEKVRVALTFNKEKKQYLKTQYTNRRLAEASTLINQGKIDMAQTAISDFQAQAKGMFDSGKLKKKGFDDNQIESFQDQVRNQINIQKNLMSNVNPSDNLHDLKLKLEKFEIDNMPNPEDKEFLEFKQFEERMREIKGFREEGRQELFDQFLERFKAEGSDFEKLINEQDFLNNLELKREILEGRTNEAINIIEEGLNNYEENKERIDAGIEEVNRIINKTPEPILPEPIITPEKIINPIDSIAPEPILEPKPLEPAVNDSAINLLDEKPVLEPLVAEPLIKEPVILEPILKEPIINEPLVTEPILEPKPIEPVIMELVSLEVFTDKYNMLVGQVKQFQAVAHYSDGSTKNITTNASWRVSGDIGAVDAGGVLHPDNDGGKGFVSASFTENGKTVSATSLEVTALLLIM